MGLSSLLAENIETTVIILLVLVGLIVLAILFGLFVREAAYWTTWRYDRKRIEVGAPSNELARTLLDNAGLADVKVEKANFFFGNRYSFRKKTIYLRRRFFNRATVAGYAYVTQMVSVAKMHAEGDKDCNKTAKLGFFVNAGGFFFVPIVLVGLILDLVSQSGSWVITLICMIFGLIFYILSLIATLATFKVEKKAAKNAQVMLNEMGILTDKELIWCTKVIKAKLRLYIADAILSVFEAIYYTFKILVEILKLFGKK